MSADHSMGVHDFNSMEDSMAHMSEDLNMDPEDFDL